MQFHPAVEGIFKPRDVLITVVDLPYYVTDEHLEKSEKDLFIITNFNNLHVAFRVHTMHMRHGFHRFRTDDFLYLGNINAVKNIIYRKLHDFYFIGSRFEQNAVMREGIRLLKEDCGANYARTLYFDAATGIATVKAFGHPESKM